MVDLSLGTILAQMLNFFILVWLLARFAYKPLLAMMTERKERIAKDLEAAEQARAETEKFLGAQSNIVSRLHYVLSCKAYRQSIREDLAFRCLYLMGKYRL